MGKMSVSEHECWFKGLLRGGTPQAVGFSLQ